ncbi:hypothetical protein [Pantoea agglomerans]|jgi:hypothetical protein
MTFTELDGAIAATGRRALAAHLISTLLDNLDNDQDGIDLDAYELSSGYVRTNIRAVSQSLRQAGIVDVYYYRTPAPEQSRILTQIAAGGRWTKQHYRLSNDVRTLFRR